jgi:RND family efflux transporter MFP subunit
MGTPRRRRRWLLIPLILLAAGGGVAAFVARGAGSPRAALPAAARPEPERVVVTVEPVTPRPVRRAVTVVGSLWGRDEVPLTAKVEGKVVRIAHDLGDRVRPGETLLELDPTDYGLAVNEARRGLELELAKLGLKEPPAKDFDVTRLPTVVKSSAQEKLAAARRARLELLGGGRAVSAEETEQAESELTVTKANTRQAVLEAESTLAAVRQRQAALDTSLSKLKDTRVVVPCPSDVPAGSALAGQIEYVVAQRSVSEGEMVRVMPGTNTALFRLVIDRPLKLVATVPERHRGEVQVGQPVELSVEAYPGEAFAGSVARVNPVVDRTSRTFQVEVTVPNADRRLSPGSFAKVAIQTHTDPAARTVPEEAVVAFAGVTKVFVVRDGKAHAVPVRPRASLKVRDGERNRVWVEVEGDLPAGAAVATSGQTKLADDTPVRVREALK